MYYIQDRLRLSTKMKAKRNIKPSKKKINEALDQRDIRLLRDIIRAEIAAVFKDLWTKRQTWS